MRNGSNNKKPLQLQGFFIWHEFCEYFDNIRKCSSVVDVCEKGGEGWLLPTD
jgi:hypothetical protein